MSVNVGDLLTATAAPVTGNPTPTRSWQWFRGTTAISGANGSTYSVQIDDLGFTLSVQQIETNLMGVRRATSAPTSEVVSLDPDALAYIAAVETADGEPLEAGVKTAINDFVVGCKADGIWDALKASCILAGARTLNGALVPLKGAAPTNFNFVSEDYNRKTGLKGDGSTKRLRSNRDNNADPQNSKHLAVMLTENHVGGGNYALIGQGAGSGGSQIIRTTGWSLRINSAEAALIQNVAAVGLVGASRDNAASINYLFDVFGSVNVTSAAPLSDDINVFARSRDGGDIHTNARLSFYSIGEAIDLAALDTRVSNLMTALDGAIT